MPKNSQKIGEANFKTAVFQEYFGSKKFKYMQEVDRIDFVITDSAESHLIWAETKKEKSDIVEMFVQLILTIGKARAFDKHNPPPFLCVFDYEKIAFLQYIVIHEIFYQTDFNWNVTPSDHKSKEFKQIKSIIEKTIEENDMLFSFDDDKQILQEFIKNNFSSSVALFPELVSLIQIDISNFVPTYNRWLETVKPSIAIDWDMAKKGGIIDGDFYLADLLSTENVSLKDRLLIVLQSNHYKFAKGQDEYGISLFGEIQFKDNQKAYNEFWRKYKRPPLETYWDYIIERRDLLVPQDIRERKGSFFTPQIWVQKSQEYLAKVFGINWQDEYYVWDCAAGTGNLLVGLINKYNIWASTLDNQDVGVMRDRIKNGATLLENHVFQFDFLNDEFDKLPEGLKQIIDDPEKRKKLIVYINPPYAESSGGEKAKSGVSTLHKTRDKYQATIGKATNEIFSQFLARIYHEIPNCNLGFFSKLKYVNGSNFKDFREFFKSSFLKGFICKGNTFDNVTGEFPICFSVWLLQSKKFPHKIQVDVFDEKGNKIGKKSFYNGKPYINKWITSIDLPTDNIGKLYYTSNDFQQNKLVHISLLDTSSHLSFIPIGKNNFIETAIYFSNRLCIEPTWLNDRDQFLYPNDEWKKDKTYQYDCIVFTLFHGQNRISAKDGTNHWIPFTAQEIGAKDNFKSDFMSGFLKGKRFSKEANAVIKAGKELWTYYNSKIKGNDKTLLNASFYDIREFFQGRSKTSGSMNTKSNDDTYNDLIKKLRQKMSVLAEKIKPKVYEYGFLME
jgi:hypothetical protein